jgi:hypothetical protein
MMEKEMPFACDMTAIAADQRNDHLATIEAVFHAALAMEELPDGYSFRFGNNSLEAVFRFIALERLCCPFFGFSLEVEPEGGPIRLAITGRSGVKPFIMAEIGEHLSAIPS